MVGDSVDGRPTLTVFADEASLKLRAEAEGVDVQGSLMVSGPELLMHYQRSQQSDSKIAGIVFHSRKSATDAKTFAFSDAVLKPMLGIAFAARAERSTLAVAGWLSEGRPDPPPLDELKIFATHPFGALLNEEHNRLLSPPPTGPLLVSAPDLMVATQMQLAVELGPEVAAGFAPNHYTLPAVVDALLASGVTGPESKIMVMHGWARVSEVRSTQALR